MLLGFHPSGLLRPSSSSSSFRFILFFPFSRTNHLQRAPALHLPRTHDPSIWPIALAVGLLVSPYSASRMNRKSVARINNTSQDGNYRTPWLPGALGGGSGTGWVVPRTG